MTISPTEQLMIELINRARLDPLSEAARNGIDLNQGLSSATLAGSARQVLAPNLLLQAAAEDHSQWMLDANIISHTGAGGSSVFQRIVAADYVLTPPWLIGDNISWRGSTGPIDLSSAIVQQHDALFASPGHRLNILGPLFREIGVAQVEGSFTAFNGITYPSSSMVTQKFAFSGPTVFVTGVAFNDADGDQFYSVGEGVSGIRITVAGTQTVTADAGGYAVGLNGGASVVPVQVDSPHARLELTLDMSGGNAKLDVIGETGIASSVDTVLLSGVSHARLLGVAPLSLTGSAASEVLTGNNAGNRINGGGGNDTIYGGDGRDTIIGGAGDDFLFGGRSEANLRDVIFGGDGNDYIDGGWGNDELHGGAGNDTILGGFGADTLIGNAGDDLLVGGPGADLLFGGPGNDTLIGGFGNDRMNGGPGADHFVHNGMAGWGSDWIQDYNAAEGDRLVFTMAGATRAQFQVNAAFTPNAGAADVAEAFVIYRPTGQIIWALVDGMGQSSINVQISGQVYDLLA